MAVKLFLFLVLVIKVDSLKLERVFILGRHNVRTPLTKNLQRTTALEWPPWDVPAGHLTQKGGLLEEILGEYFTLWFQNKGLYTGKCPDPDSVYVYSNNKQRTVKTAESFAKAAFKDCNITVHYNLDKDKDENHSDPVFAPLIRNGSDSFKQFYYRYMNEKLNNLRLEDAYEVLDQIVDIKTSDVCKYDAFCDFNMKKNNILFAVGEEPNIDGPLAIGNFIADFILMTYYNGFPEKDIAWGKIKTEDEWMKLSEITKENQNVRFNNSYLAKDVARHLLNYIQDLFLNENMERKLTVLVGHDSNLSSVMAALGFKIYNLPGQYELTPIGGKLVFQKWRDDDSNYFLKIEYIYQTRIQLRNATLLSLENPPFTQLMELSDCTIDENGYCPWNDFLKVLESLY